MPTRMSSDSRRFSVGKMLSVSARNNPRQSCPFSGGGGEIARLTSSGDAQRTLDGLELVGLNERRVGDVADIDLAVLKEAGDVLGTEAVADATDALCAQLALELLDDRVDNGVELLGLVVLQPAGEVKALRDVDRNGVAVEEVGHNDEVAIGGVLIGDAGDQLLAMGFRCWMMQLRAAAALQLGVDELMAENVSEDHDSVFGALVLRVRDIGVVCSECELPGVYRDVWIG